MAAMHGPHQVAQTSTIVILPLRSSLVIGSELRKSLSVSSGAGLPTMGMSVDSILLFMSAGRPAVPRKVHSAGIAFFSVFSVFLSAFSPSS